MRYHNKIECFFNFAELLAKLSTCKRLQNGAIVFPFDCSMVYSIGYNGPPRGMPNNSCTNKPGNCGCVHAEANAIIKLNYNIQPCFMFTTTAPCINCANAILNARVIKVLVYRDWYRNSDGFNRLRECGIDIIRRCAIIPNDVRRWYDSI